VSGVVSPRKARRQVNILHPDGKSFVTAKATARFDIWIMELAGQTTSTNE
jgi:hypothetical protein